MTSIAELNEWRKKPEGENLEFKAATQQFDKKHKLPDYCAALANMGGGKLILGIDKKGNVVGTEDFVSTSNQKSNDLLNLLGIRVNVEEIQHPDGRVVIFHVPSRAFGTPIPSRGRYWMRAGESLTLMDPITLKNILNETQPDFSAQIVPDLQLEDLDDEAITNMQQKWSRKARRPEFKKYSKEKALKALNLLTKKGLNFASLILLGKKGKIDQLLPCSEIIFEWRQEPKKTTHDYRTNWRQPFFKIYDSIWEAINAKNLRMPFQEGFVQREIWAFEEKTIREAVLNAVAHRDYSIQDRPIFIKASPDHFWIESPGGLLPGITLENILHEKAWRNYRMMEVLEKTGLVERSGQGMNDIFKFTVQDGKGLPDLSNTDKHNVRLKIPARIQDKEFILFLEKLTNEQQANISEDEIYALEQIRSHQKVNDVTLLNKFLKLGVIEKVGKTRGTSYILSKKYFEHIGKPGLHTKNRGITRDEKRLLILKHMRNNQKTVSQDLQDALDMSQMDINNLLQELKRQGKIKHVGHRRGGYWALN